MLLEEFVKPLKLTQTALASSLGVSYPRLNEIVKGRRSARGRYRKARMVAAAPNVDCGCNVHCGYSRQRE
jgi:hypothetical protein